MKKLSILFILTASPAFAKPFFSLANTDFVVTIAFILFVGVLLYFKVPGLLAGLLDKRAEGIKSELEQARALREEAQTILASYERKQQEVKDQSVRIIDAAKTEAETAAAVAREELKATIARRLLAAEDQIKSAQNAVVKDVRDRAVSVAIAAAGDVIAKTMAAADSNALIDAAIGDVEAKLH